LAVAPLLAPFLVLVRWLPAAVQLLRLRSARHGRWRWRRHWGGCTRGRRRDCGCDCGYACGCRLRDGGGSGIGSGRICTSKRWGFCAAALLLTRSLFLLVLLVLLVLLLRMLRLVPAGLIAGLLARRHLVADLWMMRVKNITAS
jgi:hypothetical protein